VTPLPHTGGFVQPEVSKLHVPEHASEPLPKPNVAHDWPLRFAPSHSSPAAPLSVLSPQTTNVQLPSHVALLARRVALLPGRRVRRAVAALHGGAVRVARCGCAAGIALLARSAVERAVAALSERAVASHVAR
jgi:hypothetical protein